MKLSTFIDLIEDESSAEDSIFVIDPVDKRAWKIYDFRRKSLSGKWQVGMKRGERARGDLINWEIEPHSAFRVVFEKI